MKPLVVTVMVDKAIPDTGPHRNVVSSLNALALQDNLELQVLCGRVAESAPFLRSSNSKVTLGFAPAKVSQTVRNFILANRLAKSSDIIYVPTGLKTFFYAFASKGKAKLIVGPNVPGIPGLMPIYNPSPLMTEAMADHWIENSPLRLKECLNGGTKPERVSMILHSIDLELFNPKKRNRSIWQEHGINPHSTIIIHVGRWNEARKGAKQFFESCNLILEKCPTAVVAVIGGDQEKIDRSNLSKKIFFLGPRFGEELATLYASADAFLGTSSYETFWFTPLEAMASGIPIFVTPTGAVPEMISADGNEGYSLPVLERIKFKPDAERTIAKIVGYVINNKDLLTSMGAKARNTAENKFSEARLGSDLVNCFRKLI